MLLPLMLSRKCMSAIRQRDMAQNLVVQKSVNTSVLRVSRVAANVSGNLDKLIHERQLLVINSALAANEKLSFNELKNLLAANDGSTSAHARKLEEAGYLTQEKSFQGRMPLTEYKITTAGREALIRYLDHMEALIKAMKNT